MLMAWFGARGFNTYRGIDLVIQRRLYAAQLAVAVYQFDGIVWGVRQVVDLVPAVAQMMQPLTRVAMLLDTTPKIEPSPDRPSAKQQLRPARLAGRIEFTDVDFTYPSERQVRVIQMLRSRIHSA
jgi:ABC-type bacteriocin/lantibiotic exporter with double-glycine peptidase domain